MCLRLIISQWNLFLKKQISKCFLSTLKVLPPKVYSEIDINTDQCMIIITMNLLKRRECTKAAQTKWISFPCRERVMSHYLPFTLQYIAYPTYPNKAEQMYICTEIVTKKSLKLYLQKTFKMQIMLWVICHGEVVI